MAEKIVPEGYQTLMPYLLVVGAASFIDFAQKVFDAKEKMRMMRDETTIIQHAEITIDGSTIMVADATEEWKALTVSMFIYVANADDVFDKAIAAGATAIMPLSNQNYGRTCGIKDPFGNIWWITSVL